MDNAKSQASSTWGTERSTSGSQDQPISQAGIGDLSPQLELLTERVDRALGTGRAIGGILARLISDKEDRLNEVRACIDWYRNEEVKRLQELDDLRAFVIDLSNEE